MLEPEARQALLDNLRPPAGCVLDRAVGTTYTLDLLALLTAPLAFALFDRVRRDDSGVDVDPIALLEAVRRHAAQIDIFCQAGLIAPMREYRPIVSYLEESVHPSLPKARDAIFHPKIWAIRYSEPETEERRYRFLCLTRNLTFDQSWDTVAVLDGTMSGGKREENAPLAGFLRALPSLAIGDFNPGRRRAIRELADEFESVQFELPPGFHDLRFWPLGHDGVTRWPFDQLTHRMVVISPFLTATMTERLRNRRRSDILISRMETFDHLGAAATQGWSETLVLNPDTTAQDSLNSLAEDDADPANFGVPSSHLGGLHAKCYVADGGRDTRIWTGSANATDPAFGGNVEFLIELIGRRRHVGIDTILREQPGQPTLRTILEPYRPANAEPSDPTLEEEVQRTFETARRRLGSLAWVATASTIDTDVFAIELEGGWSARRPPELPEDLHAWPMSLRGASARLEAGPRGLVASFPSVSLEALSSFFVLELGVTVEGRKYTELMAINGRLLGAPVDRTQRLLATLLRDKGELLRFLLLLLSDAGFGALGAAVDGLGGAWQWSAGSSPTLFEPLLRALATDPSRLDDIASLVAELSRTSAGVAVLPEGWSEIWDPIWAAREGLGK